MDDKTVKLQLEFDGWHCLSRRQTKEILRKAREEFLNANFFKNIGLLIEDKNELAIQSFCLRILRDYSGSFANWNGYEIKKISRKLRFNYADRKRKLKLSYFQELVKENVIKDIKLVLAGILYLEPEEVKDLLISIVRDSGKSLKEMTDDEIKNVYNIVIMYASSKDRTFSLNH